MPRELRVPGFALQCFALLVFLNAAFPAQSIQPARAVAEARTEKFYRTDIYFGRARLDGTVVSNSEWKAFLDEIVTPRFPDGFTVLHATGQYREKSGRIISEPSEALIVLYPAASRKESRAKIEEIRTAYLRRFAQESVLRVDLPKSVRVSF